MKYSQPSAIITKLTDDLLQARRDGDVAKKEILQSTLTRITNAQAVSTDNAQAAISIGVGSTEGVRRNLSEEEIGQLIQQEIDELREAVISMSSQPHHPYLDELKAKIVILTRYTTMIYRI